MTTAIALYILLLIVFLVISSLILRHAIKFSYLSPRFKYVVGIFSIISIIVIIFSLYLLLQVGSGGRSPTSAPSIPSSGNLNF